METADTPCVLLLHLPVAALGGIDLLSFAVSPRFRGIKDVPSGLHFLFTGASTAFSERHGLWFHIPAQLHSKPKHAFVTKWDASSETLVAETDQAELLRWRANLGSIWREGLTPYQQSAPRSHEVTDGSDDWPVLTSAITPELLSRITGGDSDYWSLSSASSAREDLENIPGLDDTDKSALLGGKELKFLPIDLKQTWREGATGRERTNAAQDRTWALENVIRQACTNGNMDEIIGELQFCFLMILTINNFSCLEQWKRLLTLVFTARTAVVSKPDFFVRAIATLRLQLQHCKDAESGLIDLADESGSMLRSLLSRFRKGLESTSGAEIGDVTDELDDLEGYLRQEHGWQFGGDFARSGMLELEDGEEVHLNTSAFDEDDETGEFAPQIVDLTPEQATLLGVYTRPGLPVTMSRASLHDGPQQFVQSDGEDDDSDEEIEKPHSENEEEEEIRDLEDMDSRF